MQHEHSVKNFFHGLLPFIVVGMGVALAIVLIKLLLEVAFWGIIIGLVLYAGVWLKEKIFPNHSSQPRGRVIEGESGDRGKE